MIVIEGSKNNVEDALVDVLEILEDGKFAVGLINVGTLETFEDKLEWDFIQHYYCNMKVLTETIRAMAKNNDIIGVVTLETSNYYYQFEELEKLEEELGIELVVTCLNYSKGREVVSYPCTNCEEGTPNCVRTCQEYSKYLDSLYQDEEDAWYEEGYGYGYFDY